MPSPEVSRRGFLRGIAALAASASVPTSTIQNIVSASQVPPSIFKVFVELTQASDIGTASRFVQMWSESGTIYDVLPGKDIVDIYDAVKDFPEYRENPYSDFRDVVSDAMATMEVEEIERLIGRPLATTKLYNIVTKNGFDPTDFADEMLDFNEELLDNVYIGQGFDEANDILYAREKQDDLEKTPSDDNSSASDAAKSLGGAARVSAAAKAIANKISNFGKDSKSDSKSTTVPSNQKNTPAALPAPTGPEILNPELSRIKDLAGIKKKEPK